ncbi:CrcB protein [Micrococcales bacterium KH10]|nr:CrcB protein [Micrococcales bacterium KH10]
MGLVEIDEIGHTIGLVRGSPHPFRLSVVNVAVVFLGGGVGTLLRAAFEDRFAPPLGQSWPWVTWLINVIGCMALGVITGVIATRPLPSYRHRVLYLCVTTGLLGGFTTYSTYVLEAVELGGGGLLLVALGYAASSIVVGIAGVAGGYLVGRRAVREVESS